ncbi:hypothetical protein QJS10_CPA09g00571 [Acorus calamus]|uniref:Uncharacterized protein n=1 Tax=Acorus calamus TaxID=4465 RepID=A0AAV9E6N3_ACOCL|nr:hypothetical protein QJS10_CPA09g00571 [Acorus calamus]
MPPRAAMRTNELTATPERFMCSKRSTASEVSASGVMGAGEAGVSEARWARARRGFFGFKSPNLRQWADLLESAVGTRQSFKLRLQEIIRSRLQQIARSSIDPSAPRHFGNRQIF